MIGITVEEWVRASKSTHLQTPELLEVILNDLKTAGFPPEMEVTSEMVQSHLDPGTFNTAFNDALCACS